MAYLLDANIFIQAKNEAYAFDICPDFWDWLIEINITKQLFSIQKIASELSIGSDELCNWVKRRGKDFFLPPDSNMIESMKEVSEWVSKQPYKVAAKSKFLDDTADYYLVSHALAYNYIVVTHEKRDLSVKKVVKIPNVCDGLNIECINLYEMLKREQVRFVRDR